MTIRRFFPFFLIIAHCFYASHLHASLENNSVIDHEAARRIEFLSANNNPPPEDFNACQITWTIRELAKSDPYSGFTPHEIILHYESKEIIKLTNFRDGSPESIKKLGLNCLEFNDYVYLFVDALNYETRSKFNLSDFSYVAYSADKGATWSPLRSLHPLSIKSEFVLPHEDFRKYVKIFGDSKNHALSIFNLRDETTYLLDPHLTTLKTVPVYNRLSDFLNPVDFYFHDNVIYLVRGSCEMVKGRIQCPDRAYIETSHDFGRSWKKETLPYIKKSYFLTIDKTLYNIYFSPCHDSWFGLIPAFNQTFTCGNIQLRKLDKGGKWTKPRTLVNTADELLGTYNDAPPILVWRDLRFHKNRPCAFIPLIGCVDSNPVRGPMVIYAGRLDVNAWHIDESIIQYQY